MALIPFDTWDELKEDARTAFLTKLLDGVRHPSVSTGSADDASSTVAASPTVAVSTNDSSTDSPSVDSPAMAVSDSSTATV